MSHYSNTQAGSEPQLLTSRTFSKQRQSSIKSPYTEKLKSIQEKHKENYYEQKRQSVQILNNKDQDKQVALLEYQIKVMNKRQKSLKGVNQSSLLQRRQEKQNTLSMTSQYGSIIKEELNQNQQIELEINNDQQQQQSKQQQQEQQQQGLRKSLSLSRSFIRNSGSDVEFSNYVQKKFVVNNSMKLSRNHQKYFSIKA